MRSITLTLLVDLVRRGWLVLPAAALVMFVLPAGVFSALRREGYQEVDDPAQIMMYYIFVQIGWVALICALGHAQGAPSRFFTFPVRAHQIVAWLMAPAMLLTFVATAVSSALVNRVYGYHWPVWGPAVFGAVVVAAFQAGLWLSGRTLWVIGILTTILSLLGVWFKTRHGALVGLPDHYWHDVTLAEAATLLVAGLGAYGLGVVAVARARRGDAIPDLGFVAWAESLLEQSLTPAPFRTPDEAQRWYVWRRAGYTMPAMTLFLGLCGLACWLLASREPRQLWEWTMAGPFCLLFVAMMGGMILGNMGSDDNSYALGQFLGTRPMTTTALARATLFSLARGMSLSWLLWLLTFLVVAPSVWLSGTVLIYPFDEETRWMLGPGALIGGWAIAAGLMVLGLYGRTVVPLAAMMLVPTLLVGLINGVRWALPESAEATALLWLTLVGSLLCVGLVGWSMQRALANGFISTRTAVLCVGVWALLSAAVVGEQFLRTTPSAMTAAVGIAVMTFAVLPVAAAPLALSWNRVR